MNCYLFKCLLDIALIFKRYGNNSENVHWLVLKHNFKFNFFYFNLFDYLMIQASISTISNYI